MNAKVEGVSARGRPKFGWMDGVKRALNDRRMDVREASERARNFLNSQLNTSGREPRTCDTPVSHSVEELKSIAIIGNCSSLL